MPPVLRDMLLERFHSEHLIIPVSNSISDSMTSVLTSLDAALVWLTSQQLFPPQGLSQQLLNIEAISAEDIIRLVAIMLVGLGACTLLASFVYYLYIRRPSTGECFPYICSDPLEYVATSFLASRLNISE